VCGICGVAHRVNVPGSDAVVPAMLQKLHHRGPDSEGVHAGRGATLGVRRLAIIDVVGGNQPLYNEDRSIALVVNGMIYNYSELTRELESAGHRFRTRSDCEVIVHAYEEYGPAFVRRLRGMFAFALLDEPRGRLVLGRDPMGQKPLYYAADDARIVFASELHALMASGAVERQLDAGALDQYFHYQFVPEPRTPIAGVRKLPAGSLLEIDIGRWSLRESIYWRMLDAQPIDGDPVQRIRAELESVGQLVVRSDVPVGVALSGGLDSAVVAALATQTGTPVSCFSVGYPGRPGFDERAHARRVADHLKLEFHEVEIGEADVVEGFAGLVASSDDPIADIAAFGYSAVSRAARRHGVPVLLQGQGGDELFWYADMQEAAVQTARKASASRPRLRDYFRPHPPRRVGLRHWLKDVAGLRSGLRAYQRDLAAPANQLVFYDVVSDFLDAASRARAIYGERLAREIGSRQAWAPFTVERPWPRADLLVTERICATYLAGNGIALGDRLSMSHSVEQRLPFVDDRFVDLVMGLRMAATDVHLPPKAWLRQAAAGLLPASFLNRPKQGFQPPVRDWHDAIFRRYGSDLEDGVLVSSGVLDAAAAKQLARGAFPRTVTVPLSYKALVLEHWLRSLGSADWRIGSHADA
jgi:asparagine synthase (glutamine-hydrolysing)